MAEMIMEKSELLFFNLFDIMKVLSIVSEIDFTKS